MPDHAIHYEGCWTWVQMKKEIFGYVYQLKLAAMVNKTGSFCTFRQNLQVKCIVPLIPEGKCLTVMTICLPSFALILA